MKVTSIGRPSSSYGPSVPIAGTSNSANPWTLISYMSPTQVDTYTDINDTSTSAVTSCSVCRHDEVALDGLARPVTKQLISDPEGPTKVDTAYDPRGQLKSVSHAYRSTSDVTYGIETLTYDALGRATKVTHPDTTYSVAAFGAGVSGTGVNVSQLCSSSTYGLGYPTLLMDESGRRREIWTDALDRTIEGDEPDSSGNLTSAVCYSYDPLGNLLQVVHGTQTRTYAYDALSRVTSFTIPERATSSGTNCAITFTYDNNSNIQTRVAPNPNQNASCTSGAVTTTYAFDALNRLTKKAYSDGSPDVQYGYDGTALSGCATAPPTFSDSNKLGRMTAMCDSSGATSWAHDALGRITTEKRIILGSTTQTISYTYNLDGSIAAITYPSTKSVTYTVNNAQRLTSAKDTASGTQFALAASYAAPGGLQSVITGQVSGGFGGVTESHSYNNSLEYTATKATSTAGTAMDLALSYGLSGADNGTVTKITNNADNGRTQTLGYDPLNRISSATSQATSGTDCWGQNFSPDSLANLNTIGSVQCTNGTLSVNVNANNQITNSGFGYDAMGNMLQDGTSGATYSFDDENRLYKVTGVSGGPYCYVYDGNGLRVAKKSGANSDCTGGSIVKLYWRSLAGDAIAETDSTGNTTQNEYVFFAGRRIASRTGAGAIFYYFADHLGTTRTITTGNGPSQTPGQLCYDADFTPYGQEMQHSERLQTTACPPDYRFTGYEFDSETGLDYAFARYYSPRLGRFMSTDPLGGSIGNLQSHNAYAYTQNNPLNFVDPTGQLLEGPHGTPGNTDPNNPFDPTGGGSLWSGIINGSIIPIFGPAVYASFAPWAVFNANGISFAAMGYEGNIEGIFAPLIGYENIGGGGQSQTPRGGSGGGGSGSKLRPRTADEYKACLAKADDAANELLKQGSVEQGVGILFTEAGVFVAWESVPALNQAFFKGMNVWHLFEFAHGGAWGYVGALGPLGGGLALYGKGTIDVRDAYNQYNRAAALCAGPVPVS